MRKAKATKLGIAAILGYLIGTFPTADLVSRRLAKRNGTKADLRDEGTGNPGALNAAKTLGARWGAVVLGGDVLKAAGSSLLGRRLAGDDGAYAAGTGVVVGHCLPVWNGFRGGKGVAASAGTAAVCFPAYMPIDIALAGATLVFSKGRAELATYVASAVFTAASLVWWKTQRGNLWGPRPSGWLPVYAATISAVICYRFLSAEVEPPVPSLPESDRKTKKEASLVS
ncbi:MAG: glycerol-3-phosphate acyltransferase [Dehalococcoidia bacterium]